MQCLKNYNEQ